MAETDSLVFFVNGIKIEERQPDPGLSLLQYLRHKLRLTGSKGGCAEGGCGACTVMVSEYDHKAQKIRHFSVFACILPVCYLHGLAVTTVEGIGSTKTRLHPVQKRLAEAHGSQCGFCTPGMVMSMYALLRNNPQPTEDQIRRFLDGNLCRCTGYRPILDGFRTFAKPKDASSMTYYSPYDPTQEPIFPPELKNKWRFYQEKSVVFKSGNCTWYRPTTLTELLDLKCRHPEAKIVLGNTEISVETHCKGRTYHALIEATSVPELRQISRSPSGITFGSAVTITNVIDTLQTVVSDTPEYETRVFRGFLDVLRWFGNTQVRNISSIGGNIMASSPLSDLLPMLMAAGATISVAKKGSAIRHFTIDSSFHVKYRSTCLDSDDVLMSVTIPASNKNQFFHGYKQAGRKESCVATCNAGMRVVFEDNSNIVKDIYLAYGSMAATTILATNTRNALIGSRWQGDLVTKATSLLAEELQLEPGVPGGMCEYRQSLTTSFFFKFYLSVQRALCHQNGTASEIPRHFRSALSDIDYPLPSPSHVYDDVSSGQPPDDIGRKCVVQRATGETMYLDDIAASEGELFMALVLSERPHARLVSVDATEALTLSGVVDFITHKDIPGETTWGQPESQEEVFASDVVLWRGQTVGAIVAESTRSAEHAASIVKIVYEDLPYILTIKEAIKNDSFHGAPQTLTSGDSESAFNTCDHVLEGEARTGAQEHFYLETMGSLVIPGVEDGKMEVYTGTQSASYSQESIGKVLGVTSNKVVVKVKGSGEPLHGKQTRNLLTTLPAAVAAHRLGRPVRCVLDRHVDTTITGTRCPTWAHFKVGFNSDGNIIAYSVNIYVNAGMSVDQSREVVHQMMMHVDASYSIPNFTFRGHSCKTNLPSNTPLQGFGLPQVTLVTEQMIHLVADTLQKTPEQVRLINMYKTDDVALCMELCPCNVRRCWDECAMDSQFKKRRKEVDKFNSENRWRKRGVSMVPVRLATPCPAAEYSIHQEVSVTVKIDVDGSVVISPVGGTPGHNDNTRMVQIVSDELNVPTSFIRIDESSETGNPSFDADAPNADIWGLAVLDACQILHGRLLPFIGVGSGEKWEDVVFAAVSERVDLMASGAYREPGLHCDAASANASDRNYFVCGASCSEVEVDCLSGELRVTRTDLVIDAGRSSNKEVDIGQIEGAFILGYGLYVLEDYQITPRGVLLTQGPGTYKIPSIGNIPTQMNVHLLKDVDSDRIMHEPKGVTDMSVVLSLSAFFAIADAVKSARVDAGCTDRFQLDCPATPEAVRMACQDQFTQQIHHSSDDSYTSTTIDLS
ncbi:xanthine dehydrogenase/oxidase-like [Haliotis cracherodii]|uniref:xanthine dehydrogenase/oxidase-like n=1 Tax=Haliotis cracherodii TaxID=6455 RepID=UPI0039E7EDD2